MRPTPHVTVQVDLLKIRENIKHVAQAAGVPVIAVLKADAYGLGAGYVAAAIADLVEAFFVSDAAEAIEGKIPSRTKQRIIALHGQSNDPNDYISYKIHPTVWNVERATQLRAARPVLCVDTGQQRFACSAEHVAAVQKAGQCSEAYTHAVRLDQAQLFDRLTREAGGFTFRHAAGSSLLDQPAARFDAVRPGLALYRDAVRVSTRLSEVCDSTGPAGYTGFRVPRHGVIRIGYSSGLRTGPCLINNQLSRILEVGMQSAFVECFPGDRIGDEVLLLGDGLALDQISSQWQATPQECLLRLASSGTKQYISL